MRYMPTMDPKSKELNVSRIKALVRQFLYRYDYAEDHDQFRIILAEEMDEFWRWAHESGADEEFVRLTCWAIHISISGDEWKNKIRERSENLAEIRTSAKKLKVLISRKQETSSGSYLLEVHKDIVNSIYKHDPIASAKFEKFFSDNLMARQFPDFEFLLDSFISKLDSAVDSPSEHSEFIEIALSNRITSVSPERDMLTRILSTIIRIKFNKPHHKKVADFVNLLWRHPNGYVLDESTVGKQTGYIQEELENRNLLK